MLGEHQDTAVVPDLTEAIIGWRGWDATPALEGYTHPACFESPMMGTLWLNGQHVWDGKCRCIKSHEARLLRLLRIIDDDPPPALMEDAESTMTRMAQDIRQKETFHRALDRLRGETCCCGVNAYASREQLMESRYADDIRIRALGQVELTGEVHQFELGWRGQRARIVRVWARLAEHEPLVELAAREAGIEYCGVIGA